ncbi:MAG: histidine kinase, partial [Anaerolineaceae bacterium 4572_5.2]
MERVIQSMQTREVLSDPRQIRRKDGETYYEDITIYPLIANGVEGAVIRIDDVTEQVRLQEMMIQSEKMLSVGGLAAGMAHEINNPLAGIMQTASVVADRLTRNLPANERAAAEVGTSMEVIHAFMHARGIPKMLNRIQESGSRAAKIVTNMLSFARKSDAILSSYSLAELLDQSIDLASSDYDLKKQYDFKQIEIIRKYEKNLPLVPCEKSKIQQVFLNILRNGAEAMQEMKGEGKVENPKFILTLTLEEETEMLRIEIEDNGPGMNEATRNRVFEPFFTTKPVGKGTGLGLSVSYFIITETHNGKMNVESTPGAGA